MNIIKFCIFADYHYWKTHYPNELFHLENIMKRAKSENVDFVIHCGDFCHNAPDASELIELYQDNKYGLKTFSCLGNHEAEDAQSFEAVCEAYKMASNYEYHDMNGFRIIILDSNYYMDEEGVYHHNQPGTHSYPGDRGDALGDKQRAWLKKVIEDAEGKCILFSHATFETDNGAYDANEVRDIINKINENTPNKVIMCCNGHYHRNSITVLDNIVYFNVNSALNLEWKPDINPGLTEEFINSARMAGNCCFAKDALSAIVTISDDTHVVIEGAQSEYLFGASPEKAGWNTEDRFGRKSEPQISYADIFLK